MSRTKCKKVTKKENAFILALVEKYREGSIITRKQMLEVFDIKGKVEYNRICFGTNSIYKVGRNRYIVTILKEKNEIELLYPQPKKINSVSQLLAIMKEEPEELSNECDDIPALLKVMQ